MDPPPTPLESQDSPAGGTWMSERALKGKRIRDRLTDWTSDSRTSLFLNMTFVEIQDCVLTKIIKNVKKNAMFFSSIFFGGSFSEFGETP